MLFVVSVNQIDARIKLVVSDAGKGRDIAVPAAPVISAEVIYFSAKLVMPRDGGSGVRSQEMQAQDRQAVGSAGEN